MRQRQAGRHGPIWDAVRVRDDRFESLVFSSYPASTAIDRAWFGT